MSKTVIAAYVGLLVALYTSISGQKIAPEIVNNLVNWIFLGAGFVTSAIGFYKTHKKLKKVDSASSTPVK